MLALTAALAATNAQAAVLAKSVDLVMAGNEGIIQLSFVFVPVKTGITTGKLLQLIT